MSPSVLSPAHVAFKTLDGEDGLLVIKGVWTPTEGMTELHVSSLRADPFFAPPKAVKALVSKIWG
ncbi:hypothetical protein N7539_004279 [Penicillium diatomitis]|uniref:Uncharacterized protein n=1 Tax=Penicillium diatomitis TaxID=2819901 RepID=A0A9X0BYC1_9EURO|nr:uncharacterized protein N7539_004279 [Penicillium diatomitis]KAJ5489389.1 hypothetical protein N7539_004279 [Penicillium diatomitis]